MIFSNLKSFDDALPAGRLLGLDLGAKTVGLALSDHGRVVATPMETLRRTKFTKDTKQLRIICREYEIVGLVLGLPLNMNGSEGPRAQSTRAFATNVAKPVPLPLLLWDERLSTQAVTRTLLDADLSRRRRAELVDKMAAAYILQGALDALAASAPRTA